ncbi:AI-2E family transporter [Noviherbaspirillum pedocola]|uniref:AI-2E family transporter n=1 Tax=Noviherbaspirillum pedocola TaxID=2801341 RepID=A0A934W9A3_9BURK|nr:AI-2E family transporter [Noviherbaspirillum pedocola]MBK4738595.1 AI-2E family transporter [Noviherbaspirillum pedocola]
MPSHLLLAALLFLLALLGGIVLQPFAVSVIWAGILAYVTWPVYQLLRRKFPGRETITAMIMTAFSVLVLILPLLWLGVALQQEVSDGYRALVAGGSRWGWRLPEPVRNIPWLGNRIQEWIALYTSDPTALNRQVMQWVQAWAGELISLVGDIGRNAAKIVFMVLTVFFLYRDGDQLIMQVHVVLKRFFGDRVLPYLHVAGVMTRAVAYGLFVTACSQGLVAGIGYWIVGLDAPVLLGALTAVAASIPVFGTFLVWGVAAIWLLVSGHLWAGLGLLAWGTLFVHPLDNFIRPLMITSATRIPFLLSLFGVLGGLRAFGLVGMFVGPVVLAVLVAIWREWVGGAGEHAKF